MANKSLKLGRARQVASRNPVMRFRRKGTPVEDRRVFAPEDPLRHPAHDEGDDNTYYDFQREPNGSVTPDVKINPAGS